MILYEAKLNLAKLLMRTKHGIVSALGSAGQLIDTNRDEPADFFYRSQSNGGVLFFEGSSESRRITGYADGIFTFTPADVTVAVDDSYYASPVDWEFYELTQAINLGLEDLGEQSGVPQINETLLIVERQGTYTLPAGVSNLKRVYLILDEDNPDIYTTRHMSWDVIGDELVLDPGSEPTWGDKFKLVHCAPHAEVVDDDDVISSFINPMLLKWASAVYALENINKNNEAIAKINRAIKTTEAYKTRHPLEMQRDPHLNFEPGYDQYVGPAY